MKKIFTFLFVMMLTVASLFAQAPQKMSYQAVVRNSNNALVTEQNVSVRLSIFNNQPGFIQQAVRAEKQRFCAL